ncbi:MAG: TetR/AcrR family transcriptional regulator [Clostridia bacterium]|nr:TetR/AcrR family transcriptional regulator [Clostridia bacterium]
MRAVRKQEIKQRNMQTVLEQAARLFAEQGVSQTTMAQIASAAHLTERTVISYYDSRNELNRAVMQYMLGASVRVLNAYIRSGGFRRSTGLEQYLGLLSCILHAAKANYRAINSLVEIELLSFRGEAAQDSPAEEILGDICRLFLDSLEKGLADGSIRAHTAITADFIHSAVFSLRGMQRQVAFAMQGGTAGGTALVDGIIEDYVRLYERTLTNVSG